MCELIADILVFDATGFERPVLVGRIPFPAPMGDELSADDYFAAQNAPFYGSLARTGRESYTFVAPLVGGFRTYVRPFR